MNFNEIQSRIEKSKAFGFLQVENGAELYGHIPHVAPQAWFHTKHRALSDQDISLLEAELKRKIPNDFKEFLKWSNGLKLFGLSLSIYGHRNNYDRSPAAARQPFSIRTPNIDERPIGADPHYFFVGGYKEDGSALVIDDRNGKVFRLPERSGAPILNEWRDFETFLSSESSRLAQLFDSSGHLQPAASTLPPEDK